MLDYFCGWLWLDRAIKAAADTLSLSLSLSDRNGHVAIEAGVPKLGEIHNLGYLLVLLAAKNRL